MHPIHQAFVSRPVFCKLEDFFYLLDEMNVTERHRILVSVYQETLHVTSVDIAPGTTIEQAKQLLYKRWKDWCRTMMRQTSPAFVVFSVLSLALAWACRYADEKAIPEITAANERDKRQARKDCDAGKITPEQLVKLEAECDANTAGLSDTIRENKARYEWFCENVIDRLPRDDPQ